MPTSGRSRVRLALASQLHRGFSRVSLPSPRGARGHARRARAPRPDRRRRLDARPHADAPVHRPGDHPDRDDVRRDDDRGPLLDHVRPEPERLLRTLRRPVADQPGSLLHGQRRRRPELRRKRRPLRHGDDAATAGGRAVPARGSRPRGPRAHQGPGADPHVRGQHEHAARPVRAPLRPGRRLPRRPAGPGLLPADREPFERHPLQPRLRVGRCPAERPLLLHRDRECTLPGRPRRDGRQRQPVADPALQPPDGHCSTASTCTRPTRSSSRRCRRRTSP